MYKQYMCTVCGLMYDESIGWPEDGIPPYTRWRDVPFEWACPECGVSKDQFELIVD